MECSMRDQRQHWEAIHRREPDRLYASGPTPFAEECAPLFRPASSILELGCGAGRDAAYFAGLGHTVCATDFADAAIAHNRQRYRYIPNLTFRVHDTSEPLPFADGSFDAIYAHLSLHYFSDDVTRRIFAEIRRVLRAAGLLAFVCKSTADQLCGRGTMIEPDMFELDGHVRHFYSEAYTRSCLAHDFEVVRLECKEGLRDDRTFAFVAAIARAGLDRFLKIT
jgi:SAM-dependent methyltransferase